MGGNTTPRILHWCHRLFKITNSDHYIGVLGATTDTADTTLVTAGGDTTHLILQYYTILYYIILYYIILYYITLYYIILYYIIL